MTRIAIPHERRSEEESVLDRETGTLNRLKVQTLDTRLYIFLSTFSVVQGDSTNLSMEKWQMLFWDFIIALSHSKPL